MKAGFTRKAMRRGGKLGRLLLTGVLATAFCWPAGAQIAWADDVADWNDGAHGDGLSAATAYQIDSYADLASMRDAINSDSKKYQNGNKGETSGKYFKLVADIDLGDEASWTPIGLNSSEFFFDGVFDGDGHTISGLGKNNINDNVGLFGYVAAKVSGLAVGIENLRIRGEVGSDSNAKQNAGGLVGCIASSAKSPIAIKNCISEVNVVSTKNVGGLVGQANSNLCIENCLVSGSVSTNDIGTASTRCVGGLVGLWTTATNASLKSSLSFSQVKSSSLCGTKLTQNALVGSVKAGFDLSSNRFVKQDDSKVGAYSSDSGATSVEGSDLVVDMPTTSEKAAVIAEALGDEWGIDGITPVPKPFFEGGQAKGFTVTFNPDGGTLSGDATAIVKEKATVAAPSAPTKDGYEFAGWQLNGVDYDFNTPVTGDITLIATWTQKGTFPGEAKGSKNDPYVITTEGDLKAFAESVNGLKPSGNAWVETGTQANDYKDKYVKLAQDIEMSYAMTPIGIGIDQSSASSSESPVSFKGTFDGAGHKVTNVFFSGTSNPAYGSISSTGHVANGYSAFFGSIEGATVKNVSVELKNDAVFDQGSAGLVALVSKGNSSIDRCSVVGDVSLTDDPADSSSVKHRVAGLIGYYTPDSTSSLNLSYCYHQGAVASDGVAGGLVGSINGDGLAMMSCYQSGQVTSNSTSAAYLSGALCATGQSGKAVFKNCVTDQSALVGANMNGATNSGCVPNVADWASDEVKAALGTEYYSYIDANTPPTFTNSLAKDSYKVAFESDFGNLPAGATCAVGSQLTLPAALTAAHFEFKGWTVKGATDDKVHNAGEEFTMPEGDVTFVAKWELKKPTIESPATEIEYNGDEITLTAKTSGYLDCTHRWLKDDAEIEGATARQLTLKNVADSGSYKCRITYKGYEAESDPITVAISKVATSASIETAQKAIAGGGKVTFKVSANGLPEGELPVVICDDTSIEVTQDEDNDVWVAELPDVTKTYKFTAVYDGNDNYAASSAECTITVTATLAPAPVHYHNPQVVPAKTATCTEPGLTEGSKCSTCGAILKAQEVIPALGHKAETVAAKAATCTESGLTEGSKCSVCGIVLVEQKTIPAFGHDWDEWVVTKPATLKKEGVETAICLRDCDATQTRAIPRLKSVEVTIDGVTYICNGKSVAVEKVKRSKTKVTILGAITIDGDSYNVTKLKSSVFKRTMVKEIMLKTAHLTKGGVKNCLKGSKVRTITVKAYKARPKNSDLKSKYKKNHFTKANCGKSVTLRA